MQDLLHLVPTQPTVLEQTPSLEKFRARNQVYFEIDARVGVRGERTNWMFTCLFDRKNSRFYVWLSQAMSIDKLSKSSLLNIVSFAQKMLNANSLIFILPRDHPQKRKVIDINLFRTISASFLCGWRHASDPERYGGTLGSWEQHRREHESILILRDEHRGRPNLTHERQSDCMTCQWCSTLDKRNAATDTWLKVLGRVPSCTRQSGHALLTWCLY